MQDFTAAAKAYPQYVYTQVMASLYNLDPREDVKANQLNENTRPRPTPRNIRLYQGINFPNDGITFRCSMSHKGKEWLDFGWVRVLEGSRGSEPDEWEEDSAGNPRQLVRFWLFAEVEGIKYALVDVYRKYRHRGPGPRLWEHPILQRYEHVPFVRGANNTPVHPFYAVPVESIIAAACVFPDVDQERDYGDHSVGERVLYHPPLVEMCGFTTWRLPDDKIIPEPPQEELEDADVSSEGSDQSVDGDESEEDEEEAESSSSGTDSEEDSEED